MIRLFRATRGEERRFLDSSFERLGDGFVYYRHHLARGVPVTAEERANYLQPPLGGSRRAFYEAIEGREPSLPRRSWLRSQRATLAAIPSGFGFGLVLVGTMLIWRGLRLAPPLAWLIAGSGALGLLYGVLVIMTRRSGPAEAEPDAPRRFGCRRFD